MKERTRRVLQYLKRQLSEPSTWRGLALLASVAGAKMKPDHIEAFVLVGLAVSGFIGAFWPDKK
jgi:hypothetical protein